MNWDLQEFREQVIQCMNKNRNYRILNQTEVAEIRNSMTGWVPDLMFEKE